MSSAPSKPPPDKRPARRGRRSVRRGRAVAPAPFPSLTERHPNGPTGPGGGYMLEIKRHPKNPQPAVLHIDSCTRAGRKTSPITADQFRVALRDTEYVGPAATVDRKTSRTARPAEPMRSRCATGRRAADRPLSNPPPGGPTTHQVSAAGPDHRPDHGRSRRCASCAPCAHSARRGTAQRPDGNAATVPVWAVV
ncbi:DUF6233 domain-containing protein [Streptomyces fagopyri]|uniref:DUF6233 domain-containing protein n=1 Tax=Streptomyces fagopyri TaxID=2662397 RepID=UPI0033FE9CF7